MLSCLNPKPHRSSMRKSYESTNLFSFYTGLLLPDIWCMSRIWVIWYFCVYIIRISSLDIQFMRLELLLFAHSLRVDLVSITLLTSGKCWSNQNNFCDGLYFSKDLILTSPFAGLCYGKLEAGVLTFIIPGLLLGHLVFFSNYIMY